MARPIRLAAPVTSAVLVNAAEVDEVQQQLNDDVGGENGDGEHNGLRNDGPLLNVLRARLKCKASCQKVACDFLDEQEVSEQLIVIV